MNLELPNARYFKSSILLRLFLGTSIALLSIAITSCGSGGSLSNGGGSSSQGTEFLYVDVSGAGAIVSFRIDNGSGGLTQVQTINQPSTDNGAHNSYLTPAPSGRFLYSEDHNQMMTPLITDTYGIDVYQIDSSGTLSLVNGSPFILPKMFNGEGYFMGSVSFNPAGTVLYGGSRMQEGIGVFQVDTSTGVPTWKSYIPNSSNTEGIAVDPTGKNVYISSDLPSNAPLPGSGVIGYSIDASGLNLTQLNSSPYMIPQSPAQTVFDPTGRFLYFRLLTAANQIAGLARNSANGDMTTIPGSPFLATTNLASNIWAIAVHPSGKFLYAVDINRVYAFSIDQSSGALSQVSGSPFPTQHIDQFGYLQGMDLAIDPSGNFLYMGSTSAAIAIYRIDQSSGALSASGIKTLTMPGSLVGLTTPKLTAVRVN